MLYQEIIEFWFHQITPDMWWAKDEKFDAVLQERFMDVHQQAQRCELYSWRRTAKGSLAEIIVLDQFSRNIYRDSSKAFENDSLALGLAQSAIEKGFHKQLLRAECSFLYMPFMHSESATIHEVAVTLYEDLGQERSLEAENKHKAVIDRFGRYPHRNEALARMSTIEELEFLHEVGRGF